MIKEQLYHLKKYTAEVSKTMEKAIEKAKVTAENYYRNGEYLCSEAVFTVINDYLNNPLPKEAVPGFRLSRWYRHGRLYLRSIDRRRNGLGIKIWS